MKATGKKTKTKKKMPKAYSYIRFSTVEQSRGDSYRRQIEMSDSYARKHGLEIDASLRIADLGKSAFKEKHLTEGALGAFLTAVEAGKVERGSFLLVESFDRLSRAAVPKALRLFLTLLEAGITIVTLADERRYSEESASRDLTEIIISIVFMGRAWEESQRKADRLSRTWAEKRKHLDKKKLTGVCPGWLRLNKDWTEFELIPERVEVVREIFNLIREGHGKGSIVRRLNARGEPTWGTKKRGGRGWHSSYVVKILESRAVIGRFQPHHYQQGKRVPIGEEITDYFPAIIDEALFFSVQNRKPRPAGKGTLTVTNLFTHLAFDGYHPDTVMHFADKGTAKRGKGQWRYLVSDLKRLDPSAPKVSWNYLHFEKCFLNFVDGLDWTKVSGQTRNDEAIRVEGEITVLEARIAEIEARIEKFVDAIAATDDPPAAILGRIKASEVEKLEAQQSLKELRRQLRDLRAMEEALTKNIDQLRTLVANSKDPNAYEPRMRLREELRNKIRRIEVYPYGWPHLVKVGENSETGEPEFKREIPTPPKPPGFLVQFVNGCSTLVTCSAPATGPNAPKLNATPTAKIMEFLPSGSGRKPF